MRRFIGLLFFIGLFCFPARASFTNVYIAQSSAGANNGADCADAFAVGFFNSAGNWGGGAGKIGAGTTVHLCGTFAGTAGGNMLTVQGSGGAGNPVTIKFEGGAVLEAPYWSGSAGAIGCSGFNYITVDGGSNGIIKNTANGTGQAYSQSSFGIYFNGCDDVEIKNVTVNPIFVNTSTSAPPDGAGIAVYDVTVASVHDNAVTYAPKAIDVNWASGSSSGILIYDNTTDYHYWGIAIGDESGGSNSATGAKIYGNKIGPHFQEMMGTTPSGFHGDGIIGNCGGGCLDFSVYGNYVHGDLSCSSSYNGTAYIFFTGPSDPVLGGSANYFFNNILVQECTTNAEEGLMRFGSGGGAYWHNVFILNNTFIVEYGGDIGGAIKTDTWSPAFTLKNNACVNLHVCWYNSSSASTSGLTSDYNNFFNFTHLADENGGTQYNSLSAWQGAGFDANGNDGDPMITYTSFVPPGGSSLIGAGVNLTSLGISALDSDINGFARPSTGAWTAGANNSTGGPASVATPSISPPSGGYTSPQTITIMTATGGAAICYTTDGSTPLAATPGTCTHGTTYSTPFSQTIVTTTTIEAIGTESGYTNSSVATNTYTLAGSSTVATPVISPATGSYGSPQTVTITVVTGGAAICYTTDGTSPAASSPGTCSHGTTYSSPFSVGFSTTVTVKALGTLATYTNSSIASATYTLSVSACTGPGKGCDTQIRYGITNPTHCDPHAIFGNTTTIPTVYYFCAQTDTWVPIPANATPGQCSGTDKPTGVDPNLNATGCSTPGGSGTVVPNPAVRRWAYIAPAGAPTSNTSQTIGDSITTFASSSQIIDPYNSPSFKAPVWQFTDSGTVSNAGIHGALQWGVGSNLMLQSKVALSVVTNIRFRFGFTTNQGASWLSSDTPTAYMADFRFSTSASDTNFQCETSDNNSAAITVIDSGVAAAANTGYLFEIKFNDSVPNVVFSINGATVCTSTTNLPAPGSTPISLESSFIPISSAPQSMYAWWFYLETDN